MRRLLRNAPRATAFTAGGGVASAAIRISQHNEDERVRAEYRAWREGAARPNTLGGLPRVDETEHTHSYVQSAPALCTPRMAGVPGAHLLPPLELHFGPSTSCGPASILLDHGALQQPGSRLDAEFRDPVLIGRGGFGVVVRAQSRLDGVTYALKVQPVRSGAELQACLGA